MAPWSERPTIEIDLAQPEERRFAEVPRAAFTQGRRLLDAIMAHITPALWMMADAVRLRTGNRFHDEADALAGQVGANWRDIVLANVSYDLIVGSIGCSTVALPTAQGPVLARNMDWWPEDILAQASYRLRYSSQNRLRFINLGWPGAIGVVSGLSHRGFAMALNAVSSPEPFNETGYPVLFALRAVLEDASDFEDALQRLSSEPLSAAGLITLIGERNDQRVVIERTPTRHGLRWPRGDEPLLATNHYRLLFQPEVFSENELYRTTCSRYEALAGFFKRHRADRVIEDAELLYTLSDPAIIQGITAQHTILRPRLGEARLFVPHRFLNDRA
jgi:hypothetical protein